MISILKNKKVAAAVVCLSVFLAFNTVAQDVVCPICGKSFPKDVEVCPNDGTDLKALGIVLKKDSKEQQEQEQEDTDDSDSIATDPATKNALKYKRLDSGDRRSPSGTDENEAVFSDRKSRIQDESRNPEYASSPHQQNLDNAAFEAENNQLRRDYELVRARSWRNQQSIMLEDVLAEKNKEKAKRMLLNGLGAPFTSLGFRVFGMSEANEPGLVNSAEIDLNLTRYRLRTGLSTLIGARVLPEQNDLVFLEHLSFGFQWPNRFSPYIVVRGGLGGIAFSSRDGDRSTELLFSGGIEAGVDSWVNPWISISPSVGFERVGTYDTAWNSFTARVSVGF